MIALIYGLITAIITILDGGTASKEVNPAILLTFFVQVFQDLIVNHIIKVVFGLATLEIIKKPSSGSFKKFALWFLDQNFLMALKQ